VNIGVELSLLLAALGCLSFSAAATAASPEETYFETRDRYIREFAKASNPADDLSALAELETQLQRIIGPIEIEGFSKQGKINLLTLHQELGFGQVDGLRFDSGQESLLVTTDSLLNRYLAERPKLPRNLIELSRTADFYSLAFSSDAAVTYYAEIPVEGFEAETFAHAFLGVTAQDIGPFIPREIFIFVSKGSQILLAYASAGTAITDIPKCRAEWEQYDKRRSEALNIYRSSKLQDSKAFADSLRNEEQGFEAYHRCFGREARHQPFFAPLTKQAQSVANRLQRNQAGTGGRTTQ
jgi:hypothetical protein